MSGSNQSGKGELFAVADRGDRTHAVPGDKRMSGNGTQVRISTLVKTYYQGGDIYGALSRLLERRPTGTLTLYVSQGGINGMEWIQSTPENGHSKKKLDKNF